VAGGVAEDNGSAPSAYAFYTGKGGLLHAQKNCQPMGRGAAAPKAPLESATGVCCNSFVHNVYGIRFFVVIQVHYC